MPPWMELHNFFDVGNFEPISKDHVQILIKQKGRLSYPISLLARVRASWKLADQTTNLEILQ